MVNFADQLAINMVENSSEAVIATYDDETA
jgi:hypothetical protein